VELVRIESGEPDVPYFDPLDGGIEAECLFLLEAPGPKAVLSGFVSRNNPDETAKNWFELNLEAGIDRRRTIMWNIVPWYIGRDGGIRPVTTADLELGLPYLHRLVSLLSALRVVPLVGKKAGRARTSIQAWASRITIIELPHPSPVFLNRRPHHRDLVRQGLHHVREVLDGTEVVA
jgi:uracil-DNA glycosylase